VVKTGEVYIQMWTDPNRSVDNGTGIYRDYNVIGAILTLTDGTPYGRYDSQGSKANCVQEVNDFIKFILKEDFDVIIDGHCPPSKNYAAFYKHNLIPNRFSLMDDMKRFMSLYNNDPYVQEDTVLNNKNNFTASYPMWYTKVGNRVACTIEWEGGLTSASPALVKDGVRWAYTVLIAAIRNSVKR